MAWKDTWAGVKAWFSEKEPLQEPVPEVEPVEAIPEPVPEPEPPPPPPPPPDTAIYLRERGSGVFIPFLVTPFNIGIPCFIPFQPAILRVAAEADKVTGVLMEANCLRGFLDADIATLRSGAPLELNLEQLQDKVRDK